MREKAIGIVVTKWPRNSQSMLANIEKMATNDVPQIELTRCEKMLWGDFGAKSTRPRCDWAMNRSGVRMGCCLLTASE